MDGKLHIPEDFVTSSRCSVCNKFLSVPPIMVTSEDGTQFKCGRCTRIVCKTYMRNVLFENIAKFLSFPCIYENCNEKIPWGEVEDHEKVCPHRTLKCPLYFTECEDIFEVRNLHVHFTKKHKDKLCYGNILYNLENKTGTIRLLVANNLHFFVYLLRYKDVISISVFSVEPMTKYFEYDLTLSSNENKGFFISFKSQKINPYCEEEHCYKCIRQLCSSKTHPYSQNYNSASEIDIHAFSNTLEEKSTLKLLKNPEYIMCNIKLIPKEENSDKREAKKEERDKELLLGEIQFYNNNNLFRQALECPICNEYMFPPICMCKSGHTICEVCSAKLEKCPTCQAEIGKGRNYIVEDLAESVILSCHYKHQGCTFIGTIGKIYYHEMTCTYKNEV